jgi:hypothetical protein
MILKDIDFLPDSYRQAHVRRSTTRWRVVVAVLCAVVLLAASVGQTAMRLALERELSIVRLQHQQAEEHRARLAKLEAQLDTLGASAELVTYLRHPWPRTQILANVLNSLPEAVTLRRIATLREAPPPRRFAIDSSTADEPDTSTWPAARQDRYRLQSETDPGIVVVHLEGATTDPAALHHCIGQLGGSPLFTRGEVTLIETDRHPTANRFRFEARLVVRPGWGQPGGPTRSVELSTTTGSGSGGAALAGRLHAEEFQP